MSMPMTALDEKDPVTVHTFSAPHELALTPVDSATTASTLAMAKEHSNPFDTDLEAGHTDTHTEIHYGNTLSTNPTLTATPTNPNTGASPLSQKSSFASTITKSKPSHHRAQSTADAKPRPSVSCARTQTGDCAQWPGQEHWRQKAKEAKMKRMNCACMGRMSRRNRNIVKVLIGLLIIGIAVGVGVGISKSLGTGVWHQ